MAKSDYQNSEYWEGRIAEETWKIYNLAEERNIDLIKMYDKASQSIKKEMYALAEMAEEQNGMTRTQQYRFNKLLGQQGHIYKEIEKLGEEVEKKATEQMYKSGNAVYGNVREALGETDFSMLNKKEMEQMLRSPWHGSFFSERLWKDNAKLERDLNGIINDGMASGRTVTEMAVQLSNIMNQAFNNAHRLVRAETINYMNRSAIRGYKDAGVAKVQWWAAEDERTCETCGANHGKIYDIYKAPILPCHPGCRCTWLPVIDERASRVDERVAQSINEARKNEPRITKDITEIANFVGSDLEGLEFRKKEFVSLSRKVKSEMKIGKTLDEAVNRMYDNVRYASVSNKDKLVADYSSMIDKLQKRGYNILRVKNTLREAKAPYRGINTVFENKGGYKFELQFHTKESFDIKQENHILYEELRLDTTPKERIKELEEQMKKNNLKIGIPSSINDIVPFDRLQ